MATWKEKYNKKYGHPINESHSLSDISKDTGISEKGLQQIYNKGIGAYKTNPQSVRPTVTSKEQWAMARVYSSVMDGKASKVDAKELKMAKGGILNNLNFKEWFGDSKVVDENGNPLVVYHGTSNDFKVFDKDKIGGNYIYSGNKGIFFTQKERTAKNYADLHSNKNLNGNNKGYVISSYLRIENPLYRQTNSDFYRPADRFDIDGDDLVREAFESGYDGIIIKGTNNDNLYVVFEPNQIKSATDNDGEYSLTNDNITMQMGGLNDDFDRTDYYKGYYERLSPSNFEVKQNGGQIQINMNKNGAVDIHEEAEALSGGFFLKGGETDFNPDGKIKDKIVHASGDVGGMLVGKRHSNGGIKAINKSTGQPLEMEGGEVVITRDAVSDTKKRSFNGKMMTNRQILSAINVSGGGVSFADGGQVPNDLQFDCNAEYEYGGKTMCGKDLAYAMGGETNISKGGTIECGSCSWSWDRKDGGDDMYVCHRCGTDNEKYFGTDNSFEEGGFVKGTSSTEVIGMLNDIYKFPLKSGSGANQVMITKSEVPNENLYIQFGRAKAQQLSDEVVEQLFYPLGTNKIDKVTVESSSYRSVVPLTEIFSITELINFFDDKNDGQYYFRFYSNNIMIGSIKINGRKRKPTGWKKGYYFGLKDIKNDINNFLQTVLNQLPSDVGLNLTSFILGTTPNAIKNKTESNEAEKIKKEKEKKELKERQLLEANVFNYEKNFSLMNEIAEKGIWKDLGLSEPFEEEKINIEKNYAKLRIDLSMLKDLLPNFQGSKDAIQRKRILKEMKKIQDKINGIGIEINETLANTNDLFTSEGLLNYYFTQSTQSPVLKLDKPCGLPTPNGEKSRLPLSAYLNVRTKEFKNWFGDWEVAYDTNNYNGCSIMIDEDTKEPKVYYHGVAKFRGVRGKGAMGSGVRRPYGAFTPTNFNASYFADNMEYAKFYSGTSDLLPTRFQTDGFVYSLFLNVRNPIDLLPLGLKCSYKNIKDYLLVAYGIELEYNNTLLERMDNDVNSINNTWQYIRNDELLIERLKDFGYDAIFQIGDIPKYDKKTEKVIGYIEDKEFLTFYPNQVKSVGVLKSFYGNMFDDIRFKKGGYVSI